MSVPTKIWLSSPHMGGTEQKYVKEAFDTNWVAPLGPNVNGFEEDLKTYLGNKVFISALSSGTAALHLAFILLGIQPGDEIICQSMTFSASANPITYVGATPVFVDSEPDTWCMCPIALETAIKDRLAKGKQVKAIVPVHLYGMPAKMDELMRIAQAYNIAIVEDAAEALGSTYKNQQCGTFGTMACLSFNGNKIITTSGGGALVAQNDDLAQKATFLATQARDNAPHYQHSHIGYNYRMSNIVAGIGRGQMEVLDQWIAKRRANFDRYAAYFATIEGVTLQQELPENKSNRWLTAIVIDPAKTKGLDREALREKLLEHQIESRPLWKPMHLQPIFEQAPYYGGHVGEDLFTHGLCLPSGSNLTDIDFERIFNVFDTCFK
ncbi:pyridoxal phosphate-dependent aminotransferase [Taibaiella sp. KBW10]|uniref:DegT/DnrJ/EryC1/StrS family aminotransferase n=1 Tax=Taibaiella sp. KBW10 TaxID=2153357 RepID=UPI000F59A49C|nr:aminotransferase class I/II-fold pyridoxal phosphate-dependent enzyme [Taibaiella sp. KBW10]RQO32031.1 pyridoxal phosphate-dependent aminotransferase [Taibaiella sp. KBW10]